MTAVALPEARPKALPGSPGVRVPLSTKVRRVLSALGLLLLATLPATESQPIGNLLGTGALFLFAGAAIAGLIETRRRSGVAEARHAPATRRQWWYAYGAVALLCAGIVQLWYIPGGSLAGGDLPPPDGVQWLPHVFEPWSWWSGSNLGGPSTPVQTPWAFVVAIVHALGGSEVLAQRIWYSALVAGVALSGMTLARTLGLRPKFAAVAGAVYVLNPWVFSNASDDPPFYAALAMVALWASVVLATADGRLSIRRGAALILLSAPLIAYVDENPPMILALLIGAVVAAIFALILTGRHALGRLGRLLAVVLPLGLIINAFWIVPALVQLKVVNSSGLSSVSSWDWTQARATIPNGLWLNNNWAWSYPDYFPFAHWYDQFPLNPAKYAWALLAFASLLVCTGRRRIRVTSLVALVTAFIVFFSTGIRFPGSVIFNVVYALPLGWLLREPGRFLFAAGLGYGILIGITAECTRERLGRIRLARGWLTERRVTLPLAAVSWLGLAALTFPLFTGDVVPVPKLSGTSSRVQVPQYWVAMSDYLNHSAPPGRLIALPVDDFYQMPYTWYYGVDQFVPNLIARETVDPVEQGYIPASSELTQADSVLSSALIQHRWVAVQHLAQVLGVGQVLVRGDIRTDLPGRTITDPGALAAALDADPYASNLHNVGPLRLYQLAPPPAVPPQVVTDTSETPNLTVLEVLPPNSHIVRHAPLPGSAMVQELPNPDQWILNGRNLSTTISLPADRTYYIDLLNRDGAGTPFPIENAAQVTQGALTVTSRTVGDRAILTFVQPLGDSLVGDGHLLGSPWQPVGDCFDVQRGLGGFQALVVPGAAPDHSDALRLSAPGDSACVDRPLTWTGGPLLLDLWMRKVRGGNPRICVYQVPLGTCAPVAPLPEGPGWQHYRSFVEPQAGTGSLAVFLYADSVLGLPTVSDYAELNVFSLPLVTTPVVMGNPPSTAQAPALTLSAEAYNPLWSAPGTHVLVDGLTNGWLGGQPDAQPVYRAAGLLIAVDLVALAIWVLSLAAFAYPGGRPSLRRPLSLLRRLWRR